MPLLDLPSELLIYILEQLGPCFFRKDTSRLRVSRRWFVFAHEVLLAGLSLSTTCLDGFLSAAGNANLAGALEKSVRSVDLRIFNSDYEALQFIVQDLNRPDRLTIEWIQQRLIDNVVRSKYQADRSVSSLAKVLHERKHTRRLRIYTFCPRTSFFWDQFFSADSSYGPPISEITTFELDLSSLLLLGHLTDLEIDTSGAELENTAGHLCKSLQRILTTLTRLVLRVRTICPQALTLPEGDVVLPLEELTINLSIDRSPANGIMPFTRWCGENSDQHQNPWPWPHEELGLALSQQASHLVKRMRKPRVVKILWQNFETLDLIEADVLTNTTTSLGELAQWNAQSEAIELASNVYVGSVRRDFLLFYSEYRRALHYVRDIFREIKSRTHSHSH